MRQSVSANGCMTKLKRNKSRCLINYLEGIPLNVQNYLNMSFKHMENLSPEMKI